ncbi:hypothetical protein OYC64_004346 [Pagothenia borchgrevinki]
MSAAGSV